MECMFGGKVFLSHVALTKCLCQSYVRLVTCVGVHTLLIFSGTNCVRLELLVFGMLEGTSY